MAYDVERDGPSNGGASGDGRGGLTSSGTIYSPGVVATSAAPVYYHEGDWSFKDDEKETNAYQSLKAIQNYNYSLWNAQNAYNKELYNDSKKWYEKMSNTAIQRQVEDMKKAGINPVLAARYGGATTPNINAPYSSAAPYASEQAQTNMTNALLDNAYNYYKAEQDREMTERQIATTASNKLAELQTAIKTTEMENTTRIALQNMINANEQLLADLNYKNQIKIQNNEYANKTIFTNSDYTWKKELQEANIITEYTEKKAQDAINNDVKINMNEKNNLVKILVAAIKNMSTLGALTGKS